MSPLKHSPAVAFAVAPGNIRNSSVEDKVSEKTGSVLSEVGDTKEAHINLNTCR